MLQKIVLVINKPERETRTLEKIRSAIQQISPHTEVYILEFSEPEFVTKVLEIAPSVIMTFPLTGQSLPQRFYILKYLLNCRLVCFRTEGLLVNESQKRINSMVGIGKYGVNLVDYEIFWGPKSAGLLTKVLLEQRKISSGDRILFLGWPFLEDYFKPDSEFEEILPDKIKSKLNQYAREKSLLFVTGFSVGDYSPDDIIGADDLVDTSKPTAQKIYEEKLTLFKKIKQLQQTWIKEIIRNAENKPNLLFVVKMHPHEIAHYKRKKFNPYSIFHNYNNILLIEDAIPFRAIISHCSILFHYSSTTMLESYLLKIPSVYVYSRELKKIWNDLSSSTISVEIRDVASVISQHVVSPLKFKQNHEVEKYLEDTVDLKIGQDYRPSERIGRFLLSLVNECPQVIATDDKYLVNAYEQRGGDNLIKTLINKAIKSINDGNFKRALTIYLDKAVMLAKIAKIQIPNLQYIRAICLYKMSFTDRSIAAVNQELALNPQNEQAKNLHCQLQSISRKTEGTRMHQAENFNELIPRTSQEETAAECNLKCPEYAVGADIITHRKKGLDYAREPFKIDTNQEQNWLEVARMSIQNGDFNKAFDIYEQLCIMYPDKATEILAEAYDKYQIISNQDRYVIYQSRYYNFNIGPNDKVLDIGSGNRPLQLATHLMDIAIDNHAYGRAGVPFKYVKGKPLFECNIEELPFEDKKFDFVYCSHVLEHVINPKKACDELIRIAKRGYIETPTPHKDMLMNQAKISNHRWAVENINDKLVFTEYSQQQIQGLGSSILLNMHCAPRTIREKAFSALIWLKPKLFNTMLLWKDSFEYRIQRITEQQETRSPVTFHKSCAISNKTQQDTKCVHFESYHNMSEAGSGDITWEQVRQMPVIRLYAGDVPKQKEYEGMIGLSLTKNDQNHLRHDIMQAFPLMDNSIDSFQAEDVFGYITYEKLAPVINEIYRVLKPGGLFRLSVPDYGCDVLQNRSIKNEKGQIVFDPGGGGTPENPAHVWFPRIDTVMQLLIKTKFHGSGKIELLHYYNKDGTFVAKPIDYSKGHVRRTPDFDERVKNPYRPMSLVIDLIKGRTIASQNRRTWSPEKQNQYTQNQLTENSPALFANQQISHSIPSCSAVSSFDTEPGKKDKIYILPVQRPFQPTSMMARYPEHNDFYGVEQDFLLFLQNHKELITHNWQEARWHYLPVFWTHWLVSHDYGKRDLDKLQQEVNRSILDDSRTFTICQYADGPLVDVGLTSVFLSSRNTERGIDIPCLCTPHKKPSRLPAKKYLASFVGRLSTGEVRRQMAKNLEGYSDALIVDNDKGTNFFVQTMLESYIGLSPRGYGGGSFRFYEAMQLGVVPFFIGDIDTRAFKDFINWDEVSFYAPDASDIAERLRRMNKQQLMEMGAKAAKVWAEELSYQNWCRYVIKELQSRSDPVTGFQVHKLKNLETIGTDYGGWTIPKGFLTRESICYCAGAGEDISFDVGIANQYGCNVHIFDPTPRAITHFNQLQDRTIKGEKTPINNNTTDFYDLTPNTLRKLHFFPTGIWDKETSIKFYAPKNPQHVSHSILNLQKTDSFFEAKVNRLSNIMRKLKHNRIDLLKLDIEGAEYKVIDSIIDDNLDIKVLCIEFDETFNKLDEGYLTRIKNHLSKLKDFGFVIGNVGRHHHYMLIKKDVYKSLMTENQPRMQTKQCSTNEDDGRKKTGYYELTPKDASCPVCYCKKAHLLYTVDSQQATRHFVLKEVDEQRFSKLQSHINTFWQYHTCDVVRCKECGFCFPDPYVAGDERFYTLAYENPGYPSWKWEFQLTYEVLRDMVHCGSLRNFKLLEIGAGDGAFVKRIAPELTLKENILCTEYSDDGRRKISRYGITCVSEDVRNLKLFEVGARDGAFVKRIAPELTLKKNILCSEYSDSGRHEISKYGITCVSEDVRNLNSDVSKRYYDVICMFQVLEHMVDIDALFKHLSWLSHKNTSLFIAVPNHKRIEFNEQNGALLDMPPNHVGRWNRVCFEIIGKRYGWSVVRYEIETESFESQMERFVSYRYLRQSQEHGTIPNQIEQISDDAQRSHLQKLEKEKIYSQMSQTVINALRSNELGCSQWVHMIKND